MSAYILKPEDTKQLAWLVYNLANNNQPYWSKYHAIPLDRDGCISEHGIEASLAWENIASVSYRYSDEGRAAYAPIFSKIMSHLQNSGWTEANITGDAVACEGNTAFADLPGPNGLTTPENYVESIRFANIHRWTGEIHNLPPSRAASLFRLCGSYEYQSCEHPEWQTCHVKGWLDNVRIRLADRMADALVDFNTGPDRRSMFVIQRTELESWKRKIESAMDNLAPGTADEENNDPDMLALSDIVREMKEYIDD